MKKQWVPILLATFIVVLMVGAAEILKEKEILFPEITALAIGALLAPKQCWQTSRIRLVSLIAVCSVMGVLVVRYCPISIWCQIVLSFAVCQLLLQASGTTFVPMISAMILPILLQTTSWIYPVAAISLAALIVLLQLLLERIGLREKLVFSPQTGFSQNFWLDFAKKETITALLAGVFLGIGAKFCIAPPLLVGFVELSNPSSDGRKKPLSLLVLLALSGTMGAGARMLFSEYLGMSAAFCAGVVSLILFYFMSKTQIYFPPAGAIAILPFLIPEGQLVWYPLEVTLGFGILIFGALFFFGNRKSLLKRVIKSSK